MSSLCPMVRGGPASVYVPNIYFFSFLVNCFPVIWSSKPQFSLLSSRWHINLKWPRCLHKYVSLKCGYFSHINLSHVNLILSLAKELRKVGRRIIFSLIHIFGVEATVFYYFHVGNLISGMNRYRYCLSRGMRKNACRELYKMRIFSIAFPLSSKA